jgi:hypothetical protein
MHNGMHNGMGKSKLGNGIDESELGIDRQREFESNV